MRPWAAAGLHALGLGVAFVCPTQLQLSLRGLHAHSATWRADAGYLLAAALAVGASVYLFTTCYGSDPGFLPRASEQEAAQGYAVCPECGAKQTLRSRHCYATGRCINKFDHNCPILGTTIGDGNHARFWAYLAAQAFVVSWGALLFAVPTWSCLWPADAAAKERCWQQDLFTTLVMLGVTPGLAVAANIFWGLWAFHTFLACTGQTTWELLKGPYVPFLSPYFVGWQNRLPPHLLRADPMHRGVLRYLFRCPPPTPFSQGAVRNLEVFLWVPKPHLYLAQYPAPETGLQEQGQAV